MTGSYITGGSVLAQGETHRPKFYFCKAEQINAASAISPVTNDVETMFVPRKLFSLRA